MAAVTADYVMHDPATGAAGFDITRANNAYAFWCNINLNAPPYQGVPGIELLQKQMIAVLDKLQNGGSALTGVINGIATAPSVNGTSIINAMGITNPASNTSQAIQQAIIHSLLTPHRQIGLPTCNMDAIIIKESIENPERLAELYGDILTGAPGTLTGAAVFPANGGQRLTLLQVTGNTVEVRPADPLARDNVQYLLNTSKVHTGGGGVWDGVGITAINPTHTVAGITGYTGFNYPVHDVNDAFYSMFMHQVYQTNTASTAFIKSRELYYGTAGNDGMDHGHALNATTAGPPAKFSEGDLTTFAGVARSGNVATIFSQPAQLAVAGAADTSPVTGAAGAVHLNHLNGHVENLYLDKIREITPITLAGLGVVAPGPGITPTNVHVIGDRNYLRVGEGKPVYLGIICVNDSPSRE
jgi:hypothetical protein